MNIWSPPRYSLCLKWLISFHCLGCLIEIDSSVSHKKLTRMVTDSYFNLCILTSWLQYHPDVSKDSQADEVFKNIRLAYDVSDATVLFFNSLISASAKEILTKYSCWLVALYFMPSIYVFHAHYKFGSLKGNLWLVSFWSECCAVNHLQWPL